MTQTNLTRANTLTVSIEGGEFVAHFYRTHVHVADLPQHSTTFVPKSENKNTQREEYRTFAASMASELDILYQPEDLRTPDNQRKASYATDTDLKEDASAMVTPDVRDMLTQSGLKDLTLVGVSCDVINPVYRTPKGHLLSDMGILEGKYERSQKWAWATLDMCATIGVGSPDDEGKYANYLWESFQMSLVSGQLKKPTSMDGKGWTKTAWREALSKDLQEAGLLPKEGEVPTDTDSRTNEQKLEQEYGLVPDAEKPSTEDKPHKLTKKEREAMKAMESQAAHEGMAQ